MVEHYGHCVAMRGCILIITLGAYVTFFESALADVELPEIKKLRFEEDYSYLREGPCPITWPACWKYLSLGNSGQRYLTIGGEIRQRYEYTHDPLFGAAPQDENGVWLQRYSLLGDLHFNRHIRFFGQLTSALEAGRNSGPSPVDEDKLSWQNAFFDLTTSPSPNTDLTARLGRQEVVLGSGRLVDAREGPNVRRTFNGARGFAEQEEIWRVDLLAMRPRLDRRGVFDDGTNDDLGLWGLYSVIHDVPLSCGNLDLYYLGYEDKQAEYVQGTNHEDRQTIGARYWGEWQRWSWNWEGLYQFGRFGSGDIRAWSIASETGYRWRDVRWQPQVRLSVNIGSGDDNPADNELRTLNPLFPRGNYFSEAAVLGPRNFYNFHTFVDLQLKDRWTFTADINLFWRLETKDGVYSPGGQIIRFPEGSSAHEVSQALSLTSRYTIARNLVFTAIYTHLRPGRFLRETGPSENIDFTELTVQYRF